jgi:ABC-type transport system involved in multi-copper enzyme maturation permease subunit
MIRLSLLQFRVQVITAAAALAAFAILLAATGPHLASLYAASGLSGCRSASCGHLASNFLQQLYTAGPYQVLYLLGIMLIALTPAVIGLFWGAPLIARELETGTSALAWSQTVTRTRWLAVKLTVGGLAAMAVTEGLSLMQAWWAAPIGRAVGQGGSGNSLAMSQFSPLVFVTHGITPLGYAAFAFTLGVTAGALIRRTVPAMAVTLVLFAAVQIATPLWIRPSLFPAHHTTVAIGRDISFGNDTQGHFTLTTGSLAGQPGAWILSSGAVDAAGHSVSTSPSACTQAVLSGAGPAGLNCLASRGIRIAATYQPASRYWRFQWTETGIYLAVALALTGYCFRRLSRRLS